MIDFFVRCVISFLVSTSHTPCAEVKTVPSSPTRWESSARPKSTLFTVSVRTLGRSGSHAHMSFPDWLGARASVATDAGG